MNMYIYIYVQTVRWANYLGYCANVCLLRARTSACTAPTRPTLSLLAKAKARLMKKRRPTRAVGATYIYIYIYIYTTIYI